MQRVREPGGSAHERDELPHGVRLLLDEVHVRPPGERTAGAEQPDQRGPVLGAQHDAGLVLLGGRPGAAAQLDDAVGGRRTSMSTLAWANIRVVPPTTFSPSEPDSSQAISSGTDTLRR